MRSGIRWLRGDCDQCLAGDLLAYCNIALRPRRSGGVSPFKDEAYDFQLGFVAPVGGRVRHGQIDGDLGGGFLDVLSAFVWSADYSFGSIEIDGAHAAGG